MNRIYEIIKCGINGSIVAAIITIICFHNLSLLVPLSYVFVAVQIIDLCCMFILWKTRKPVPSTTGIISRISNFIGTMLTLVGLVAMCIDDSSIQHAGRIAWFGSILNYVLFGILYSTVFDVPLEMGKGGWRIKRKR